VSESERRRINGAPDSVGVGAWLYDVYVRARVAGKTPRSPSGICEADPAERRMASQASR